MKRQRIITLLFACTLSLCVWAQGITMKFQNEPLPSVLKRIEKTTDYKFVFAYDDVKNCRVTGELHDASISEAMTVVLAGQPLGYTVNGRTVNIRRTR